jgi:hypothetical protein
MRPGPTARGFFVDHQAEPVAIYLAASLSEQPTRLY